MCGSCKGEAHGEESQRGGTGGTAGAGGETAMPCPLIPTLQGNEGTSQHAANSVCHPRLAVVKLDQLGSPVSVKWV